MEKKVKLVAWSCGLLFSTPAVTYGKLLKVYVFIFAVNASENKAKGIYLYNMTIMIPWLSVSV